MQTLYIQYVNCILWNGQKKENTLATENWNLKYISEKTYVFYWFKDDMFTLFITSQIDHFLLTFDISFFFSLTPGKLK